VSCRWGIIRPVCDENGPLTDGGLDLLRTTDGYVASITRRQPGGALAWQAMPPEGDRDVWVSVTVDGPSVVANSWSGWQVRLSLGDGTEMSRRFTK